MLNGEFNKQYQQQQQQTNGKTLYLSLSLYIDSECVCRTAAALAKFCCMNKYSHDYLMATGKKKIT